MASILVVDDSRVMREMVVASLRADPGHAFSHAASGLEALERLSIDPADVVVLDLNMPDVNGYEVLEFMRSQERLRRVPVLVLTTRGDESSRARAMQSGADRFMTKPFTPDALLEQVRALLAEGRHAGG